MYTITGIVKHLFTAPWPARRGAATGGYTLAEMAIVMTIISVVVGMSVSAGVTQMQVARNSSTKDSLETIREALLVYEKKQDRYPCPAVPTDIPSDATYGVEVAGGCTSGCPTGLTCVGEAIIGSIPFKTLRLNQETTIDAWDRKITYVVEKSHTTATGKYVNGTLKIMDASGQQITASPVLGDAVFVLISHGEDGGGAYLSETGVQIACIAGHIDTLNCDNADDIFVDERLSNSEIAANYFDDLVVWQTQENLEDSSNSNTNDVFLYITDLNNNRVEKFDGDGAFISKFDYGGTLNSPHGIVADSSGNLYVADTGNNRILKFDSDGTFLLQIGVPGSGDGQLSSPDELAIDSSDNLYVADRGNNRMQKFDSSGNFVMKFGSFGSTDGQFNAPESVAVNANGNIYVVDSNNDRVQMFDSAGVYTGQFGGSGSGNGQFDTPSGIHIDSNGNVWVTDYANHRVQKFDSAGNYLSQFGGGPNTADGQFNLSEGIDIDADGNLWVTDLNNDRVQKFDSNGNFLFKFGTSGSADGQMDAPESIAIVVQ